MSYEMSFTVFDYQEKNIWYMMPSHHLYFRKSRVPSDTNDSLCPLEQFSF